MRVRYWLQDRDVRLEIGPAGLLIGRDPDCDIVIQDPYISRHHALLHPHPDGVELLALGRRPIECDDRSVESDARLESGARLRIGSRELTLQRTVEPAAPGGRSNWVVERAIGQLFGVRQARITIGGSDDDDLVVDGWPDRAVRVDVTPDLPVIEILADGVTVAGRPVERGALESAGHGTEIALDAHTVRLISVSSDVQHTTQGSVGVRLPRVVSLTFLPRGGRLSLDLGDGRPITLYLAERRCALVASLLEQPDQLIADETLWAKVWPRDDSKDRFALNTLIFRLRNDLVKAGINAAELIVRDAGCTRFRTHRGAEVRIA